MSSNHSTHFGLTIGRPHVSARAITTTAALLLAAALPSTADSAPRAHAAAQLTGTATAHLHLVQAEGSQLVEEGPVSGALTGSVRAELHTGASFSAQFAIRTHSGSIKGSGMATPHGSGRYQSFSGSFTATTGTGRYAHIRGHANLYGVIDRRTDSVTIQTVGNGRLLY